MKQDIQTLFLTRPLLKTQIKWLYFPSIFGNSVQYAQQGRNTTLSHFQLKCQWFCNYFTRPGRKQIEHARSLSLPLHEAKRYSLCSPSMSAIFHPISGCNCYISCACIERAALSLESVVSAWPRTHFGVCAPAFVSVPDNESSLELCTRQYWLTLVRNLNNYRIQTHRLTIQTSNMRCISRRLTSLCLYWVNGDVRSQHRVGWPPITSCPRDQSLFSHAHTIQLAPWTC